MVFVSGEAVFFRLETGAKAVKNTSAGSTREINRTGFMVLLRFKHFPGRTWTICVPPCNYAWNLVIWIAWTDTERFPLVFVFQTMLHALAVVQMVKAFGFDRQ